MCSICCCCCKCCRRVEDAVRVPEDLFNELQEKTSLSPGQIRHLYLRFCQIADADIEHAPRHLIKRHFLTIYNLSRNPLFPTILSSMFGEKKVLGFVDFATYLSVFQENLLSKKKEQIENATKKKYRLLFNMYDTGKTGHISKEDLIKITHKLFGEIMDKTHILNIVDIMMNEMDTSHTNHILFEDFCTSIAVFDMEESLVTRIPETR